MSAAHAHLFPHRHLTGIGGLSREDILSLLDMAEDAVPQSRQVDKRSRILRGQIGRAHV